MKRYKPILLALAAFSLIALPAWAEDNAAGNTIEINTLSCKQLMAGNDLERDVVIAYYHGLMDGKYKVDVLDIAQASAISDQVRDHCLSNPTSTVMNAFEQFHK